MPRCASATRASCWPTSTPTWNFSARRRAAAAPCTCRSTCATWTPWSSAPWPRARSSSGRSRTSSTATAAARCRTPPATSGTSPPTRKTSPRRSCASAPRRLLKALDEREDVALAVLEPGRPGAAVGDDAVRVLAGHVVVLELHAARLELAHLALDVVDLPERLARLRGAGVGRRVEEAGGALAELVRHPAGELASRL